MVSVFPAGALVFAVLLSLPPRNRTRRVLAVVGDTPVMSPIIAPHLDRVLERIAAAVATLRPPASVARTA